jgi:hypothetical protein
MLEENLALARPGRTYQILAHFADLVAARAAAWPTDRMIALLGGQPGSLLTPMISAWPVDKVLTLAQRNPEKEYLLEWLREREVERLLAKDPGPPVGDKAAACEWLAVAPGASADDVKRAWRRLLGFLNSDFGRRAEQAVHRKKDEIAKRLQQARDLLLRNA